MNNNDIWFTEKVKNTTGITLKVKETLFSKQSDFQKIDIIDTYYHGKMLLLDDLVMTCEKDEFIYHEMISHIPMLAHTNPETVLVIGGGDGGTIREVLKHTSVKKVVLCEIDGMVIDICKKYLPTIACELNNPKVEILVRDGIEYIKECKNQFDVILIDSTDPIGPGVGLFTEEFYTDIKNALKQDGIMVNQSESPIANTKEVKLVYSLLRKVFPIVKPYTMSIPTYPSGYWSWAYCSVDTEPFENIKLNINRAKEIEKNAKVYNTEFHKGVFAVPNFVKKLTGE